MNVEKNEYNSNKNIFFCFSNFLRSEKLNLKKIFS